jgi:hypothetical protein
LKNIVKGGIGLIVANDYEAGSRLRGCIKTNKLIFIR